MESKGDWRNWALAVAGAIIMGLSYEVFSDYGRFREKAEGNFTINNQQQIVLEGLVSRDDTQQNVLDDYEQRLRYLERNCLK